MALARHIRSEYVVEVTGLVESEQANPNLGSTGAVELVETITVLNTAKQQLFEIMTVLAR